VTLFKCDFSQLSKPFPHFWEHTVGSGHATLALRADWQSQLLRCHQELGFKHVRFHAILSDDMSTFLCEENKPLYSFLNADRIMDFLVSIGMHPFVELSFMPETLASGETTVFHYQANVTPPKDYEKWATLIQKLAAHWVERYGLEEVRNWFFEVWNEPNLSAFWPASQSDYFKLYRHTVNAIKSVDRSLKVGGPATANNSWIPEFLAFCKQNTLSVDFVSTHHYPTDAFGKPGADTETQLQNMPVGMMKNQAMTARAEAGELPLYYTEWNISSNPRDPLHDGPFAAAFITKIIMESRGLVQGYSFWTFSDIFEENYFPSVPFHGGFGLLNLYGIAKPAYRAFQLLHQSGTECLEFDGNHATVNAWMVRQDNAATIILTNVAMPRHAIQTELVSLRLSSVPVPTTAWIQRIDDDHCNPRRLWQSMGQPEYLSASQLDQLDAASALRKESHPWTRDGEDVELSVALPPQSTAAITIEFSKS
jgi:xylan 1,4-beta-xylosidase